MVRVRTKVRAGSVATWMVWAAAAIAVLGGESRAEPESIITIVSASNLEEGAVGADQRAPLAKARRLITDRKLAEAEKVVDEVLAFFDKKMKDPDATYVCVANRPELNQYLKDHPAKRKVIWLDWAFGDGLHKKAFLRGEQARWKEALALLKREIGYRPYSASAHTERGWILNRLRKPAEALKSYEQALQLSERYASSRPSMAIALRGIGYARIELKDLDGARKAYERSLKIDPKNRLALKELEYIKKLQEKQEKKEP